MNHTLRPARNTTLPAALAIAAIAVAGCGGDDDDGGGDATKVAIEATGSGKTIKYEAPTEVDPGSAELEFTNSTSKDAGAQLVRVRGDRHDEKEVLAEANKAIKGQPVAPWFNAAGGVGTTAPGETSTVTQTMRGGNYYVIGDPPTAPLAKFTTARGRGGERDLPEPDARIAAKDYKFEAGGQSIRLEPGESQIRLTNAGKQWHHFLAFPIAKGKTIADVKKFVKTEQGQPPFEEEGGFESAVLEGGFSQSITAELKPGKYAFVCFVSDKKGGAPHAQKGMVSEITVQEKREG